MIFTDHQVTALFSLYPSIAFTRNKVAYDLEENEIEYDLDAVNIKAAELQADAEAKEQTEANTKQTALNKLMALGLTEEEALALGK